MKSLMLKLFHKNQVGFTIIEMMAALAITGLISLGASVSSAQILNQATQNTNFTSASRNAMNALHWISRDALMAQTINGTAGFPGTDDLSLSWVGWSGSEYSANYTVENGRLKRVYSDGSHVSITLIAEHINIDADSTNCSYADGVLTVTITSSVGEGARIVDVTKICEIASRPKL